MTEYRIERSLKNSFKPYFISHDVFYLFYPGAGVICLTPEKHFYSVNVDKIEIDYS